MPMEPRSAFVDGAGVRLRYVDWGIGPEPALVFLHGGGLHARSWDSVCSVLSAERHCIAFDLRGHGESEWSASAEYGLADYAADIAAATTTLGLDRMIVVGHSLGGGVA